MLTAIISDLHLGHPGCAIGPLFSFLKTAKFDRLVLNGDTLDHLNFSSYPAAHLFALDALREIVRKRHVVLLLGNHDVPTPNHALILPRLLAASGYRHYTPDYEDGEVVIEHGDQHDLFTGTRLAAWAESAYFLVRRVSSSAAVGLQRLEKLLSGRAARVKEQAINRAHNSGYGAVVLGHTHVVDDDVSGKARYINTGSWLAQENYFVELDGGKLTLREWRPA